jgi:hypothetical protein
MDEIHIKEGTIVAQPGVRVNKMPVLAFPSASDSLDSAVQDNHICLFGKRDGFYADFVKRLGLITGAGTPVQTGGNKTSDAA